MRNITRAVWIRVFQGLITPKRHSVQRLVAFCRQRYIGP